MTCLDLRTLYVNRSSKTKMVSHYKTQEAETMTESDYAHDLACLAYTPALAISQARCKQQETLVST